MSYSSGLQQVSPVSIIGGRPGRAPMPELGLPPQSFLLRFCSCTNLSENTDFLVLLLLYLPRIWISLVLLFLPLHQISLALLLLSFGSITFPFCAKFLSVLKTSLGRSDFYYYFLVTVHVNNVLCSFVSLPSSTFCDSAHKFKDTAMYSFNFIRTYCIITVYTKTPKQVFFISPQRDCSNRVWWWGCS